VRTPLDRVSRLAAATLFVAGLAGGCADRGGSDDVASETPVRGGTLVIGGPADLDVMNGLIASEAYTQDLLLHALFLPLVGLDENVGYVPALARSWDWEGDTAIVFHIREDARWHDGTRTTAYDVAFTFDRAKNPVTAYPNASDLTAWKSASVTDSFTIRMTLDPHVEPLMTWALLPIAPRHALDSIPPERMRQAAFNRAPVGNGPFRFVEYRAGDRWIFEANPDFPEELGGRPWLDRVVWRVITENAAQVAELRTGGVDLILAPRAETLEQLEAIPGIRAIVKPSRQFHFIGWNGLRKPLDDARVRRALTLALDRGRILEVLRNGRGTLAAGPIAPFHWAFPDTVPPLPHDTAAARALLAEAGLRDTNGDGMLEKPGGQPFEIALKIQASNAFNADVAEMIQADLATVGVRVQPTPTEFNTLIADISSTARNFDAVIMGWEAGFRIDLRDTFHSASLQGMFQLASYRNPELDALLDSLTGILDREQARPRWHHVQRILRDEQPWTFLWYVPNLYAVRDRVHGIVMDERGAFINLAHWWLAGAAQDSSATR
jgi:peptide/nickel transport system substrate-binding protein